MHTVASGLTSLPLLHTYSAAVTTGYQLETSACRLMIGNTCPAEFLPPELDIPIRDV